MNGSRVNGGYEVNNYNTWIFVVYRGKESFLTGICISTTCIVDINQTEPVQVPSVGHWSSKHFCKGIDTRVAFGASVPPDFVILIHVQS